MEIKKGAKKVWNFLWKDDSLASWVVSLALAFIIVKLIFFPLLSFGLGTQLPLVIVESGSMHHPGTLIGDILDSETTNFDLFWTQQGEWYENKELTKEQAKETWRLSNGLEIGDIVLVTGRGKIEVGDIIIFEGGESHPIIHRIIGIRETNDGIFYSTKGDNNSGQLINEKKISEEDIIGKAVFKIPKIGWIKLGIVKILSGFRK